VLFLAAGLIVALGTSANPLQLAVAIGGAWAMGWHMTWQLGALDIDDSETCLRLFRSNRNAGLLPVLFLAVAHFL
jgi:4-hydroxybenzoate polyprenyltransferase